MLLSFCLLLNEIIVFPFPVLNVKSNTMNQAHQMALYELHEIEEYRKNIQKSVQLNENSLANKNLHKMFESFSSEVFVINL